MFKVNNKNTRTTSRENQHLLTFQEMLIFQSSRSGAFIANFEHNSHHFLALLLLILNNV